MPTVKASDDEAVLALFERLALDAGRAIMDIFRAGFEAQSKPDLTPVTEADRAGEAIILAGLRAALPHTPCVAEEEVSAGHVPVIGQEAFILVDPLDGTKEFVRRGSDFTVNIALVRGSAPVIGVVYAPARGVLYTGRPGQARAVTVTADFEPGQTRAISVGPVREPLRVVASRSHRTVQTDDFIARFERAEIVSVGSSLKFCLLACDEADLYPRFGRTMEWDTAAGDAVLRAAGGRTMRLDGAPLDYGKCAQPDEADFANPWFVADNGQVHRP